MIYAKSSLVTPLLVVLMLVTNLGFTPNIAYSTVATATEANYCNDSNGSSPWCSAYSSHAFLSDEVGGAYFAFLSLSHYASSVSSASYGTGYSGPLSTTIVTGAAGYATATSYPHHAIDSSSSSISGWGNSNHTVWDSDHGSKSDFSPDGD